MDVPAWRGMCDSIMRSVVHRSYPAGMNGAPSVSVLLPVLDEEEHIDACLATLAAQDYTGTVEIVIAEGGSRDTTRARIDGWHGRLDRLVVVDNPERVQAHGVNRAARAASGEVLVRADAHTTYAHDYVRRSVEALESSDAVAVGGLLRAEGVTPFGRAVAAAMRSPLAVGPGRFHHARRRGPADTVYLGAFRACDFAAVGGLRALPSGVAEDADLYYRWRRAGRTVLLDPAIRSTYHPRQTATALWRQYVAYGQGKTEMLSVNRRLPSWRPLGPVALVVGLVGGLALAVVGRRRLLFATSGAWATALAAVGCAAGPPPAHAARTVLAAAIMQIGYGVGFLGALTRSLPRADDLDGDREVADDLVHVTPIDSLPTEVGLAREYWRTQPLEAYYREHQPQTQLLIDQLLQIGGEAPVTSVFEFGSNMGRNLHFVRAACGPGVEVLGMDVNPDAVAAGRQHFGFTSQELRVGDDESLAAIPSDRFDVVCTVSVLDHLPDVATALGHLLRVARRRFVCIELDVGATGKVTGRVAGQEIVGYSYSFPYGDIVRRLGGHVEVDEPVSLGPGILGRYRLLVAVPPPPPGGECDTTDHASAS